MKAHQHDFYCFPASYSETKDGGRDMTETEGLIARVTHNAAVTQRTLGKMLLISLDDAIALIALAKKREELKLSRKKLQDLCTLICNTMPVDWGWGEGNPKPWGCILSSQNASDEWYCDQCPVSSICPNENKQFSQ